LAFKGHVPIRCKTAVGNTVLEQVNTLILPGCVISYEEEKGNFKNKEISTKLVI
jgi:hypothetical protein